eukprot:s4628_g8.t1
MDGVQEGYSPSPLSPNAVRNLREVDGPPDDVFTAMQQTATFVPSIPALTPDPKAYDALDLPTSPAACESDNFQLNRDAPTFVPQPVNLRLWDEFTQDLHALWQDRSFA